MRYNHICLKTISMSFVVLAVAACSPKASEQTTTVDETVQSAGEVKVRERTGAEWSCHGQGAE